MTGGAATLRFSVIVASRERPQHLRRTLRAIRQLDHPAFEVVVVGDRGATDAVRDAGDGAVRSIIFDEPNLSAARNIGVGAAAGDVCAFIDDDAVPEPMWLRHHEAALARTGASASAGYVRGPDGIRFQSRFASIDREAETHEETADGDAAFVPALGGGRAVKLVGTNMAVRRDTLLGLGGFDEAFRYFLEDADLSLRLCRAGHAVAVAPLAEVHHALAGSPRRTAGRAPKDLFDIGRSTAIFLRRHGAGNTEEIRDRVIHRERRRALRAMIRGLAEPRDVSRLLGTLAAGWSEGMRIELGAIPPLASENGGFQPMPPIEPGHIVLKSRYAGRRACLRDAEKIALSGRDRVSLFSFSLTSVPHFVRYTDGGVWLHAGGQFVSSDAGQKRFRWCRFASRTDEEIDRVAKCRGLKDCGFVLKSTDGGC